MKLYSPKIKSFPIFSQKTFYMCFSKWNFLVIELKDLWWGFSKLKKYKKIYSEKFSCILGNGAFKHQA